MFGQEQSRGVNGDSQTEGTNNYKTNTQKTDETKKKRMNKKIKAVQESPREKGKRESERERERERRSEEEKEVDEVKAESQEDRQKERESKQHKTDREDRVSTSERGDQRVYHPSLCPAVRSRACSKRVAHTPPVCSAKDKVSFVALRLAK